MKEITIEEWKLANILFECYTSWISYWQLISEEERESEEMFDWFMWVVWDQKYSMPIHPTERRMLHSDRWFEVKRKEAKDIYKIIKELIK